MKARLKTFLKQFCDDQRGVAMFIVALGMTVTITATGSAIDYGRAHMVQTKLSQALDAAGLAAAQVINSENVETETRKYFRSNFPNQYLGSIVDGPYTTVNENRTIIDLNVSAQVPTVFLNLVGINSITVSAESQISRENKGMELILVLDTTGSMTTNNKIGAMKEAAEDLVHILYGGEFSGLDTIDGLWVGLVPYVTAVNIGTSNLAWTTGYSAARYTAGYPSNKVKWKGCVEGRSQTTESGANVIIKPDPANVSTLFPIFFWADHNTDNDWISSTGKVTIKDGNAYVDGNNAIGPNVGCGDEVVPMQSSRNTVVQKIRALSPWNRTGTMSSSGIAWAWRMLDPTWRGMWNHVDASLPLDYRTPLMNKVVILLTDGENQFYRNSNPPSGINTANWSDYTPWGRIGDGRLKTPTNATITRNEPEGRQAINKMTLDTCNAMKAQGIIIYTITFGLGSSSNVTNCNYGTGSTNEAKKLFCQCATEPAYYFDSPDNATLNKVFKQIGDSLGNLRISH